MTIKKIYLTFLLCLFTGVLLCQNVPDFTGFYVKLRDSIVSYLNTINIPPKAKDRVFYIDDFDINLTDTTDIRTAVLNMADSVGYLNFKPSGKYYKDTNSFIQVAKNIPVYGNGATITAQASTQSQHVFYFTGTAPTKIYIENLHFKSENIYQFYDPANPYELLSSNINAIQIIAAPNIENVTIKDCSFENMGYGIRVNSVDSYSSINNRFKNCTMSTFVFDVGECNISFTNSKRPAIPNTSILVHHDYYSEVKKLNITNCHYIGGGRRAIQVVGDSEMDCNINVSNTHIDSCKGIVLYNVANALFSNVNITDCDEGLQIAGPVKNISWFGGKFTNTDTIRKRTFLLNSDLVAPVSVIVSGLITEGPTEINLKNFQNITIVNSIFNDGSTSIGGYSDYIIGIPPTANNTVNAFLFNVEFRQTRTPTTVFRVIRSDTGLMTLNNCRFFNYTGAVWPYFIAPLTTPNKTIEANNCKVYNSDRLIYPNSPLSSYEATNIRDGDTNLFTTDAQFKNWFYND